MGKKRNPLMGAEVNQCSVCYYFFPPEELEMDSYGDFICNSCARRRDKKSRFFGWLRYNPLSQQRRQYLHKVAKKQLGSEIEEAILTNIGEADPTPTGEYGFWILKLLSKQTIKLPEDVDKLREALTTYHKMKRYLPAEYRDINRIKAYADLRQLLTKHEGTKSKKESYQLSAQQGQEILAEEEKLALIKATTPEAARELAQDTGWCVKDTKYGKDYLQNGPLYFFYKIVEMFEYTCKNCGYQRNLAEKTNMTPKEAEGYCGNCWYTDKKDLKTNFSLQWKPYALVHEPSKQAMDIDDAPISEKIEQEILPLIRKYIPNILCKDHKPDQAGLPIRHCKCGRRNNCQACRVKCASEDCASGCQGCVSTCVDCQLVFCFDHYDLCKFCSKEVCKGCVTYCAACFAGCPETSGREPSAKGKACQSCTKKYLSPSKCKCKDSIGLLFCPACLEIKCQECSKPVCGPGCRIKCHNCEVDMCQSCGKECLKCNKLTEQTRLKFSTVTTEGWWKSNPKYCHLCISKCSVCSGTPCDQHRQECIICKKEVCSECFDKCDKCDQQICLLCKPKLEVSRCLCGNKKRICPDCTELTCKICNRQLCGDCIIYCEADISSRSDKYIIYCGKRICQECSIADGECNCQGTADHIICSDCAEECENCGVQSCPKSLTDCGSLSLPEDKQIVGCQRSGCKRCFNYCEQSSNKICSKPYCDTCFKKHACQSKCPACSEKRRQITHCCRCQEEGCLSCQPKCSDCQQPVCANCQYQHCDCRPHCDECSCKIRSWRRNPLSPLQKDVFWSGRLATKWIFPNGTFVVGFENNKKFSLLNLRVPDALQKQGIGLQTLQWLTEYYPKGIQVLDVQTSAIGFWHKALQKGLITRYTQETDTGYGINKWIDRESLK